MGTLNSNIFYPATRSSPVLYREYCVLYSRWQPRYQVASLTPVEGEVGEDPGNEVVHDGYRLATHALLSIFQEVSWVLERIRIRVDG